MFARSVVAVAAAVLCGCLSEDGDGGDGEKKSAVGESCTRTADCESGAHCVDQVCVSGGAAIQQHADVRDAGVGGRQAGDALICGDAGAAECTSDDAGVESCVCPSGAGGVGGAWGVGGAGGAEPPADPTVSLAWDGDNIVLKVVTSAENGPYLFGLAETGLADDGWYGEDCIDGVRNDHDICHEVPANGELTLVKSPIGEIETEGKTLVGAALAPGLTYVLIRDTEDNAGCWTWGHNTTFYKDAPLSCNEITPVAP